METIKDFLNFCDAAIFHDYKNVGITCELNQIRKCVINSFYKTVPHSRILISLSLIDEVILKIHGNEIEKIVENIRDLRENVLFLLSFQKLIKDEQQTVKTIKKVTGFDEKSCYTTKLVDDISEKKILFFYIKNGSYWY